MNEERDALTRALVAEYRDVLTRRGPWQRRTDAERTGWRCPSEAALASCLGAREALRRVAERLGVTDLHERAADVVARGESS